MVPAKTPAAVAEKLNAALNDIVQDPEVRRQLANAELLGASAVAGGSRRLSARRARQLEQDGRRESASSRTRPRRFDLPSWRFRRAAGAFASRSFLATLIALFIRARFGGKEKTPYRRTSCAARNARYLPLLRAPLPRLSCGRRLCRRRPGRRARSSSCCRSARAPGSTNRISPVRGSPECALGPAGRGREQAWRRRDRGDRFPSRPHATITSS